MTEPIIPPQSEPDNNIRGYSNRDEVTLSVSDQNVALLFNHSDKKQRTKAIVDEVVSENPDIATFQELFTPDSRKRFLQLKHFAARIFPDTREVGDFSGAGLGIISRLKPQKNKKTFYPFTSKKLGADKFANKGILYTRLEHPTLGSIDVYTVHFQPTYSRNPDKLQKYSDIRLDQIAQLKYLIRSNRDHDNPVIVTGDFNFEENSPEYYQMMAEPDVIDVMRTKKPEGMIETWGPKFEFYENKNYPNQRLDYVFLFPGIWSYDADKSTVDVTDNGLSDHAKIIAHMVLKEDIYHDNEAVTVADIDIPQLP